MKSLHDARRRFPRLKLVRFNGRAAASLRNGTKITKFRWRGTSGPRGKWSKTIHLKATDRRRPVPCLENASPLLKKRVAPPPISMFYSGVLYFILTVTSSVFASFDCLCLFRSGEFCVCGRTQVSKRKRAINRKEKQTNKNLCVYEIKSNELRFI